MMGKHWLCELLGHKFKYLKPWFVCERCGYYFHNPYPPQGNIPPPYTTIPAAHAPSHQAAGTDDLEGLLRLANLAERAHGSLTGIGPSDHHVKTTSLADITDHDLAHHALGTVVPHDALASLTEKAHTSLTGVTPDQHHNEIHGAAKHTNVTRELFLPVVGYTTGTIGAYGGWDITTLIDGSDKTLHRTFKVPDDFVSFLSLKAIWSCSAASGNMRWGLSAAYASAGQSYDTHQEFYDFGETASGGANILNVQEPVNALALAGLVKGDYVGVTMRRDGGHANDTLNADVKVYGLLFTYTAEQ